jgi:hypothetical protein
MTYDNQGWPAHAYVRPITTREHLQTPMNIGKVPYLYEELGGPMVMIEVAMIRLDHSIGEAWEYLLDWKDWVERAGT